MQRKIDVVPAHWYDTADYQLHGQKRYREVGILDKSVPEIILNRPFAHMAVIDEKDRITGGGAKRVIRLLKTLRSDADVKIELTSYDIASLVWHMNDATLSTSISGDMSLVASALRFLRYIASNQAYAMNLDTPDGSRKIFDGLQKFVGLMLLTQELGELAGKIIQEQNPILYALYNSSMDIPDNLSKVTI